MGYVSIHPPPFHPMSSNLYPDRLGFCYVLINSHMPGICKIGATRKHPLSRTKELGAATGVPGEFSLAYYQSFGDSFAAETLTHHHFADHRVNEGREFFALHVDQAIEFLHALPNSVAYRERALCVEPDLVTGGEHRRAVETVPTPFADLFLTFQEDGRESNELTPEERAQCRALERRTL